jgi:hypothetical protein
MNFNQKSILTAMIISATAVLILGCFWLSLFISTVAWISLYIITRSVRWKHKRIESRKVFESLHINAFGKEWIGGKAEVVLVKDTKKYNGVEVLARTPKGHWFIVEISITKKGKGSLKVMHEININAAKAILNGEPEIYESYFGIRNKK